MNNKYLLIGIQIAIFIAFIIVSLGLVFSHGVCCADDAYNAMVAKNLADGYGYTSSLPLGQSHSTLLLFDPLLGTGPTIILPAALMIKLVGNTYWVPGVTNVILWSILILGIGIVLNKLIQNKVGMTIASVVFFVFAYQLTTYHFEQWYALLGEIPAALLIILGVLIYFLPDRKINLLIIGILFSLAFEAKMVALIPIASFVFFIILYLWIINRHQLNTAINKIAYQLFFIGLGFCIPIFLIEGYRIISLHPAGYLNYWRQSINYIGREGVVANQDVIMKIIERIGTAVNRFGIFLPVIFIIFIGIEFALQHDKFLMTISTTFILLIAIFTIYWLVFSIGRPRYFFIPLIIIIIVLALPFLSSQLSQRYKIAYALVLIGLSIYNMKSIDTLYPFRNIQLFLPSSDASALADVSNLLSSQIGKEPFLTQWWATAIDVEYLLKTHLNFTTFYDPEVDFNKPQIIVINEKFLVGNDDRLSEFIKTCNTREIGRYYYIECNPHPSP